MPNLQPNQHTSRDLNRKIDNRCLRQDDTLSFKLKTNKHCEALVSCSDKERNCIQAHGTVCKLMDLGTWGNLV